ncbi:SGNH/GDSL hydrolase family protein [Deinococcus hopiensis]|uniref:Lysophospholipase L1 n=1 Tax=Deinococcus hopiensis KR-140 TaxID=695939 RepID=A0A1W1UU23_9DEIO|nr:GDSL-type esterase/lipase family protein [Deinococcus hopiensis]SMB84550.1 hypothetical protein SAMN00790413_05186 [Deinococcus hopiensis KR-140]
MKNRRGLATLVTLLAALSFWEVAWRPPNWVDIPAVTQVHFFGRWFPERVSGGTAALTINQGSGVQFEVTGASAVWAEFVRSPASTLSPTLVLLQEEKPERRLSVPMQGNSRLLLASNLPTERITRFRLIVDGIHEHDPLWQKKAGLALRSLSTPETTARFTPWQSPCPPVLWIGTSIFAGILARGKQGGSTSVNSAASLAYPTLATQALGAEPYIAAFGAVGVTRGGSGGVPAAPEYMQAWAQERPARLPAFQAVVIGEGVNDVAADSAQYREALERLIRRLHRAQPRAPVFLEAALNGAHAADTQWVAQHTGSTFVDTSTWRIRTTDGLHPNLVGHREAAARWLEVLKRAGLPRWPASQGGCPSP